MVLNKVCHALKEVPMSASDFGKDHGLMHEVVVTGRRVGADEFFWSSLAHDSQLFSRVREFVDSALVSELRIALTPVYEPPFTPVNLRWYSIEENHHAERLLTEKKYKLVKALSSPKSVGEWYSGVRCDEADLMYKAFKASGRDQGIWHVTPLLNWLRASENRVPIFLRKFSILLPGTILLDEYGYRGIPKVHFSTCYDNASEWNFTLHSPIDGVNLTHQDYFLVEVLP